MAPHLLYILTKIRPSNDFGNLAITFGHDLQMTRNWYGSKALVEAHLFRGVSSQSEHFQKIEFSNQNAQPLHFEWGVFDDSLHFDLDTPKM